MLDVTRQRVSLHSDHSPWFILLDLVILLAQHGVIYFIHIIIIIVIVFGHTVQ